jgi:hypothetical protein
LQIRAQNNGWGPASDAVFVISEPTLDCLLKDEERRYHFSEIPPSHGVWCDIVPTSFSNDQFLLLHQSLYQQALTQLERE